MGGLRVMVTALLVAVCVVQHAESRSVKKRNIDDEVAELLVRFMEVGQTTGILVYQWPIQGGPRGPGPPFGKA